MILTVTATDTIQWPIVYFEDELQYSADIQWKICYKCTRSQVLQTKMCSTLERNEGPKGYRDKKRSRDSIENIAKDLLTKTAYAIAINNALLFCGSFLGLRNIDKAYASLFST